MTAASREGGAAISATSWASPALAVVAVLAAGGGLVAVALADRRRRGLGARFTAGLAQGGER